MKYSWAEYYRKAYELEKKKNIVLAGKVADAEGKREELQVKYGAICANPLYRMLRPFSLVKRGCGKILRKAGMLLQGSAAAGRGEFSRKSAGSKGRIVAEYKSSDGGKESTAKVTAEELSASYKERLAHQKNGYGQWIREVEPVLWQHSLEALSLKKAKNAEECRNGTDVEKNCHVVSYQELAGITNLQGIFGVKNSKGRNAVKGGTEEHNPKATVSEPDIILFAENPEELDERAVSYITDWFAAYPETKLFYGAEDHQSINRNTEERHFPWFKPCWSPDALLGFFYFGSYFAVDRKWAEQTVLAGYEDARRNLYDFVLRLLKTYFEIQKDTKWEKDLERKADIVCTDLILYHQRSRAEFEVAPDGEYFLHTGEMREGVNLEFWGYEKAYAEIRQNFINSICYSIENVDNIARAQRETHKQTGSFLYQTLYPEVWSVVPEIDVDAERKGGVLVSVVIPSKDHPELLKKCIGSFLERTSLPELHKAVEFIVVDNGSNEENRQTIQAFLESVKAESHYIYRPMIFNFSAMCNLGAAEAKGEYILLLNDDMEIIEENWLRILLGQALLPGTGAVGAKLWYPKGERIQHAGITNMHIGPSHKLVTFPDDRIYYYGHNAVTYDMIAVTAACLLVRKTVYEEVGGLDEEMAVSYNDVDFCFKVAEAGYRNVIRNDAVLLHHESASRGLDEVSDEKWLRLLQEKTKLYKKHPLFNRYDHYYSEELADNAPDYRIGYQYPYERLLLTEKPVRWEGKGNLQKILSGMVMLTVERAGKQHKIHLEEPDILETEGWCYMLGQDNCQFERWLILEAEQGDFYYHIPVKERRRPDVEAILPQQKNIELSGFVCRVLSEDIISGDYVTGMLYRNLLSGRFFYRRSNIIMKNS